MQDNLLFFPECWKFTLTALLFSGFYLFYFYLATVFLLLVLICFTTLDCFRAVSGNCLCKVPFWVTITSVENPDFVVVFVIVLGQLPNISNYCNLQSTRPPQWVLRVTYRPVLELIN